METITMPTNEEKTSEAIIPKLNGKKYSHVGLLLLSEEFHVLFINHEAQELMEHLKRTCSEPLHSDDTPPGILSLIDDLIEMQSHSNTSQEWSPLQCRRITGNSQEQVLLRGFVFPQDSGLLSRQFLVILEKVVAGAENGAPRGMNFPKRYGLTERQKTIVRYVTTGRTNKQIAEELGISVYTVKEHIKHVMRKTGTNTRTAAIARLTRRKSLVRRQQTAAKMVPLPPVGPHEQPSVITQPTEDLC